MTVSATLRASVCACGLIAGCATLGDGHNGVLNSASSSAILAPGNTTRAEVVQALGTGKAIRFRSGYEIWLYEYDYSQILPSWVRHVPAVGLLAPNGAMQKKELKILFDPQGIVKKYALIDADIKP